MKNRWRKGKAAVGLDPDFAIGYTIVAYSDMYLNRLDQAESILRAASERKLEIPEYFVQRYDIAFLKDDSAGMKREATLAQAISGAEDWISNHQAFVFAYSGRLQESRRISRQATDLALRAGQRERAALYQAGAAVREALFGNFGAASRTATAGLELSKAPGMWSMVPPLPWLSPEIPPGLKHS
jgi:eukaryotic-like serine/threonine-protein kinase